MNEKKRYPRWVICRDRFEVEIRLLEVREIEAFMELLRSLDEEDQAKLPNDVTDPNYPQRVRRQIKDGLVHRLIAWHGDEIVGSLALYRGATRWLRHTGTLVHVTHPKYRRYGIATVLFDEMIPLAESLKIRKVYANLIDAHREAISMAKANGFHKEATLEDHVMDSEGRFHRLYIYSMDLEEARRAMADRMSRFMRLDHRI